MKIIVLGQQKGGVGKSTLCGNIAVALAEQGQRVIIVDADKQQTAVKWGSRRQLTGIMPKVDFAALIAKDANAKDYMATLRALDASGNYDVCLIDVGGRDNRELRASLALAHILVAPCLPSQADVESLAEFDDLVGEIMAFNPALEIVTVINKANTGLHFSQEIMLSSEAIAEMPNLPKPVATVTERPTYRSAWIEGKAAHDLGDTPAAQKARAEIDAIVRALPGMGGGAEIAAEAEQ